MLEGIYRDCRRMNVRKRWMKRVRTNEERERSVYDVSCEWLACLESHEVRPV
jgi:hypothetical protein